MRIHEFIIILFTVSGKWKRHFAMISLCSHKLPSGKYCLNIVSRNPQIKYLKILSSSNVDNVLIHTLSKNVLMQLYNAALCPCVSTLYLHLSSTSLCFLSFFSFTYLVLAITLLFHYFTLLLCFYIFVFVYFSLLIDIYFSCFLLLSFLYWLALNRLLFFFIMFFSFFFRLSLPYFVLLLSIYISLAFFLYYSPFAWFHPFLYFLICALLVLSVTFLFRHVSFPFSTFFSLNIIFLYFAPDFHTFNVSFHSITFLFSPLSFASIYLHLLSSL